MIEPAAGADRATLAFLLAAYDEEEVANGKGGTEKRTVLRLAPAPRADQGRGAAAVEERAARARWPTRSPTLLRPQFMIDVDDAGSIGRRYRRQDEVGTPLCVTVDFDTLDDRAVTVRDRDTMSQERVPIDKLVQHLEEQLPRMSESHYELLGVESDASKDEIRSAYRERIEALRGNGRERTIRQGARRRPARRRRG